MLIGIYIKACWIDINSKNAINIKLSQKQAIIIIIKFVIIFIIIIIIIIILYLTTCHLGAESSFM